MFLIRASNAIFAQFCLNEFTLKNEPRNYKFTLYFKTFFNMFIPEYYFFLVYVMKIVFKSKNILHTMQLFSSVLVRKSSFPASSLMCKRSVEFWKIFYFVNFTYIQFEHINCYIVYARDLFKNIQ